MAISGGRAASRVPVTILTGFLGSGKTTLLNYILSENHGLKAAVIVNEFGEVGIDHQLVVGVDQASGIVELSNGCICCSINTDLYGAVLRLLKSNRTIEYLIVETTGVADPQPVAQTFFLPELERRTFLDSIIALVDAVNFPRIMHESEVAAAQVAFADFVVINKVDDAFPQAVRAIERHIRHLNPYARILHTNYARVPLEYILDVGAFSLDKYFDPAEAEAFRRGEGLPAESLEDHSDCDHEHGICHHDPHGHEGHESEGHHHASTHLEREGFISASFVLDRPLRAQAFQSFLEELPTTVYRGKGILWFLGESRRAIFQQVGSTVLVEWGKPWGQEEPLCQLVFIGTSFDKTALYKKLLACAARE